MTEKPAKTESGKEPSVKDRAFQYALLVVHTIRKTQEFLGPVATWVLIFLFLQQYWGDKETRLAFVKNVLNGGFLANRCEVTVGIILSLCLLVLYYQRRMHLQLQQFLERRLEKAEKELDRIRRDAQLSGVQRPLSPLEGP